MHPPQNPQWISYVATALVVGLVLILRLRAMRRARRLRIETLWLVPAVIGFVLLYATWEHPPLSPAGWLWLVCACAVGAVVGWQRGKLMRITVDPATHQLNQQSSPAALLFIVALILVRQGLRFEAAQHGINVFEITSIALAFAFGLMATTRLEMYLRAKRLLSEARGSGPAAR